MAEGKAADGASAGEEAGDQEKVQPEEAKEEDISIGIEVKVPDSETTTSMGVVTTASEELDMSEAAKMDGKEEADAADETGKAEEKPVAEKAEEKAPTTEDTAKEDAKIAEPDSKQVCQCYEVTG